MALMVENKTCSSSNPKQLHLLLKDTQDQDYHYATRHSLRVGQQLHFASDLDSHMVAPSSES